MLPWARGIHEGIITYKCTSHSFNIKAMNLVCNSNIIIFSQFDIGTTYKDLEIVLSKSLRWSGNKLIGGQVLMLDGWEVCSYENSLSSIMSR